MRSFTLPIYTKNHKFFRDFMWQVNSTNSGPYLFVLLQLLLALPHCKRSKIHALTQGKLHTSVPRQLVGMCAITANLHEPVEIAIDVFYRNLVA